MFGAYVIPMAGNKLSILLSLQDGNSILYLNIILSSVHRPKTTLGVSKFVRGL